MPLLDNPTIAIKPTGPEIPKAVEKEPVRELLDQMTKQSTLLVAKDPSLVKTIEALSQQGNDPARLSQEGFKTRVAYALQDMEKHTGRLEIGSPQVRAEMHRLAGTAPGLENERMQELLRGSHLLHDKSLLTEIRKTALDIGARVEQKGPEIDSRVDALENRVRLSMRTTDPSPVQQAQQGAPQTAAAGDHRPSSQRPAAGDTNSESTPTRPQYSGNGQSDPRVFTGNQNQAPAPVQHSVLDTLLRAMRPDGRQAPPPWEPPHTPMADRIAAEDRRVLGRSDERAFENAEKRGQAALGALQSFANGEGAAVMSKIREAAKTEPGGMAQVLSEMKEGGRFSDLRKQFSNALADDAGVAAAYDKAASSLAAYGKNRTDVQDIIGRRADNSALTQRFDQLDAEIGKAASTTPSKTDGRSMMEDLGKQAAELLQRAVETVKAAFRSPTAGPSAGAGSSPSMSP